ADCPTGLYEARLLTRLGISSSRVFCVGDLSEQQQQPGSTTVATAMPLSVNSICNSQMTARSIDHYRFEAEAGTRYVISCESRGIESRLDPVLVLANAAGQDLIAERQRGVIEFTAKLSGTHVIKVHELTYKGGVGYYYRLGWRQLAAQQSVPSLTSVRPVRSF
ncbi:MAG: serine protease, partial [Planctomycetaceae bacterium]